MKPKTGRYNSVWILISLTSYRHIDEIIAIAQWREIPATKQAEITESLVGSARAGNWTRTWAVTVAHT